MKTQYRYIEIVITGKSTAALSLQLKVNALADYLTSELKLDTTTVTGAVATTQSISNRIALDLIDGAVNFYSEVKITCNDASDILVITGMGTAPHEGLIYTSAETTGTATTITSIQILVSTSTWIAGTEISIYGIKR